MSREYSIALIPGDGIGPEITEKAVRVLDAATRLHGLKLIYKLAPCGDAVKAEKGAAVPDESLKTFLATDACLKGPVGETVMEVNRRFRFDQDLYANIRPARSYPTICPPALRPNIDLVVIRENSEGFYRALEDEVSSGVWSNIGVFTEAGCRRIARFAFEYAKTRLRTQRGKGQLVLAHKANVFPKTHGMFLKVCQETAAHYREVNFRGVYADAMCALLVREPEKFDVILAENLIADLLSDLAGQVAGGLGMTPGTNINYEKKLGYFEPTHGSAPDIAGKGVANPIGQIRSAALMLDFLGICHRDERCLKAAQTIEEAVDIYLSASPRERLPVELGGKAGTKEVGDHVFSAISEAKRTTK